MEKAVEIVQSCAYEDWSEQISELKKQQRVRSEPRSIDEVIKLIHVQIESHSYEMSKEKLKLIEKEAKQVVEASSSPIKEDEVKKLLGQLQGQVTVKKKLKWLSRHRVEFVVLLIKVWKSVTEETPYNTQLISLLLFLHTDDKGLLQQVKTGEGKTMIVAMLAAAKALMGFRVDIVSSNRDLAEDGVRKCQGFFCALHLHAAANCTESDDSNQQAYKSHIVYGDVGSFERDVLTEETEPGDTAFHARYLPSEKQRKCLIVDEVDSMFLDKGRHMLYISHESPAMKHLESMFIMIWSSVLSSDPGESDLDAVLEQLATDLKTLIKNKLISIPAYLTEFCFHKMQAWVYSAYQARFMEADVQDADKKRIMYLMNRIRLDAYTSCHSDFILLLSNIREKYVSSGCQDIRPVMELFDDLY